MGFAAIRKNRTVVAAGFQMENHEAPSFFA